MYKKLHVIVGMMFLISKAIGQTSEEHLGKEVKEKFTPQCYFAPLLNVVNSNLNYGNDNSSVAGNNKQSLGLQACVSVQAVVSSRFSVLSELYYIRKGGKLQSNNPLTSTEVAYRFNSLELPVLARVHFGRVHINAGPSIAYNLSGSEKTNDLTTKMSFKEGRESFSRFEAGIQMGGGYTFPFKKKSLILDIRYNYGLTNISYSKEMFNRNLAVSLILIKQGKKDSGR
ncbi:porin family protein [Aridibaculum aurantiacum]|uniref:porin family protein n=1 Tax=Aridibaculum aurantiacum TaxID=2810307 RepID=UPI001A975512|nr:porin family protein [Aridibaculum aurantiacum]